MADDLERVNAVRVTGNPTPPPLQTDRVWVLPAIAAGLLGLSILGRKRKK